MIQYSSSVLIFLLFYQIDILFDFWKLFIFFDLGKLAIISRHLTVLDFQISADDSLKHKINLLVDKIVFKASPSFELLIAFGHSLDLRW